MSENGWKDIHDEDCPSARPSIWSMDVDAAQVNFRKLKSHNSRYIRCIGVVHRRCTEQWQTITGTLQSCCAPRTKIFNGRVQKSAFRYCCFTLSEVLRRKKLSPGSLVSDDFTVMMIKWLYLNHYECNSPILVRLNL